MGIRKILANWLLKDANNDLQSLYRMRAPGFLIDATIGNPAIEGTDLAGRGFLRIRSDGDDADGPTLYLYNKDDPTYPGRLRLDNIDNWLMNSTLQAMFKRFEIGAWNMDATGTKEIDVSSVISDSRQIIGTMGKIRHDDNANYVYSIPHFTSGAAQVDFTSIISHGTVRISREASGTFDSTNFNRTDINRGMIGVWYIPADFIETSP